MVDLAARAEIGDHFLRKLVEATAKGNLRSYGSGGSTTGGEGKWFNLYFQHDDDGKSVQLYACVCEGERGPVVKAGLFEGERIQDQIGKFRERHNAL